MKKAHIFQRGKTWTYIVDLPPDPLTKKRRQKKKGGFPTEEAAEIASAELLLEIKKGTFVADTKMTVEEYFLFWLENYSKVKHQKTTYATNKVIIEARINPEIGKHKMSQLTPDILERFFQRLLRTYSPVYVHGIYRIVRSALRLAYFKWDLIKTNIMDKVDAPQVVKPEHGTWTLDQCSTFLEHAEISPFYIAYLIVINSGLRRNEVLGITEDDVSIDNSYFEINQTMNYKKEFGFFTQPPKTKKSKRKMPIVDDYILEQLDTRIKRNQTNRESNPEYVTEWGMLLNCHEDGSPISPAQLRHDFAKIIQASKLPVIRFHDLRHSFATNLWELGFDLKDIGELLGHSGIGVTSDIYTHMRDDKKKNVMSGFSTALKGRKKGSEEA